MTGQRRRGRVNVMGGVRYHDRKRICFFIEKGNGDTFYEQLELNEFLKKEWVAGHLEAEFPKSGPKILIILDNASYHKKQDIREKIARSQTFNYIFCLHTVPILIG